MSKDCWECGPTVSISHERVEKGAVEREESRSFQLTVSSVCRVQT